ncbi:sugar phosphatase [Tatumella morbirosei]|uniref:Sugar phosphatase n=1 Tax=Tatumella morbirosei TaxID=642227 RepID=A0A095VXI0_9GAMM|nr:sugar-phosphatase [Tatumella morbirosei]KGD79465.1 sugar phosphatase [Tatumella morbirosei]
MAIKLIALDMDGTLLDPEHKITPAVKSAIARAQAQGIIVVLASGRPHIGMKRYITELGLDTPGQFCISYNGALVQRADDGSCVAEVTLGHADYLKFWQLSVEYGVHFQALDKTHLYTPNKDISKYTVHEVSLTGIPLRYRSPEEMDATLRFPKLMMIDEPELLDAAITRLPPEIMQDYTILKSAPYYLEILNNQVNKGEGVRKLAELLGFTADEVMAIGDHENDLAMIAYAGSGVAMGNAIDSVKRQARYQTTTNAEDGVARAIEKWALTA